MRTFCFRSLVAFFMLAVQAAAYALPVRFYSNEQLSSNQVTSLCQDRQGFVWIGTEYGLNRFDGVFFRQYYNDENNAASLYDNIVRRLFTDRDGTVWVVSNTCVQRYNRLTDAFDRVMFDNQPKSNVNDILQTPDGKIWLMSAENGVYEVDGELKAKPLTAIGRHIDRSRQAENMFLDSRQRLWVAYQDDELVAINLKTGKSLHYGDQLRLADSRAVDITEDKRHGLMVLTYTSVLQLNEKMLRLEPVASYQRNAVEKFFLDRAGRLLIGTSGSGLWEADIDRHEVRRAEWAENAYTNMNTAKVTAFMEDRDGNRWIGCMQRGLLLYSSKAYPFHFIPINKIPESNGKVLRTLYADKEKNVYVCQEEGGIIVNSPAGETLHHWMRGYTVMSICRDAKGAYWVGTYRDGMFRIDPKSGREEHMPLTAHQRITSIVQDRQGNIYTASFNDGIHCYTPDGKTERPLGKGRLQLDNPYLNKLFIARDGKIWIGHYYGIDVYDPKTDRLADISVPEMLRPAIVYAIEQSPRDQSIWVGTNRGLFQYSAQGKERGQWKRFTTRDGLPNDVICGIVTTRDGTLWLSTYRGLAQIETDGSITRYYRGNGLEEWSYLRGACAWTGMGEVVLGSQGGITYFNPGNIAKSKFSRGIMLTGMRLGNTDVNAMTISNDKHILTKPLDEATDITVSYLDHTFSLRFSTMDFRDAQNVHYEFRFEGEDEGQWHSTESGRSEIYFSHLSVGTHHLIVRAYDNGTYSPEKKITIHVTPPWYRSPGAYAFYLMIVLAIATLWWRYYKNKRLAAANEEKIKFFVDLSHELRSPLTLIKSPLDQLLRQSHDTQTTRALSNMERNTSRLLKLVNQILSIRKIEKGQMTLHYAETPLADFVESIVHDFDYQTEKRQIRLTFHNEAPDMRVWIDRDHFDKVVTNLLSNAIKYVENGGEIDIIVRQCGDKSAEFVVRDNGRGIDEKQLKKIFERFYQTSLRPVTGYMSYGIGLNLTQKIVALHRGTVKALNRTDCQGSEFIVRLPLGCHHLSKEQIVDDDYFAALPAPEEDEQSATHDTTRQRKVRKKTTYHIAVVDDDDEIRSFLETELGDTYHVHGYRDGQAALEGIVDNVPDLVVSDVVMPRMDGMELLKRLKSSTRTSHIPVILLTTKTAHKARIDGLEHGADAYIDKPFDVEELEACIASLIANRLRVRGKFSGMQEQEDTVRKIELKGNDAALMEKIMKTINERLDDSDFNVEALASAVGLSRVQLHRRMKELTGITVGEFIRNLRLQQAASLLEKGDTTIAQVTYAVGFANPTHFSAAFKKHFGVTPTDYMLKSQKTPANDTKS